MKELKNTKELLTAPSTPLITRYLKGTIHLTLKTTQFSLDLADNEQLASVCGLCDEHLAQLEQNFSVEISHRGHSFVVTGEEDSVAKAIHMIQKLQTEAEQGQTLSPEKIHLSLQEYKHPHLSETSSEKKGFQINGKFGRIKPRSDNQALYLERIQTHDINFGIGPAGTGKTFLAIACAIDALDKKQVERILLVRPAVEAGERLGFLPGDLAQKVDPYLRPLYDALYEIAGLAKVNRWYEQNIIEIAPLAYMRGRTLSNSFIILDESQNTTKEQMKMFLTRIGFGATVVITGDITQVDLPKDKISGLYHAMKILKDIDGISFTFFDPSDIVRHPLVEKIVRAYTQHEKIQDRFG